MLKQYLNIWKQALDFKGRSPRSDYIIFNGFNLVLSLILPILFFVLFQSIAPSVLGENPSAESFFEFFIYLFAIVLLIPGLALAIRRLHDLDMSGFFSLILLVPLVSFVLFFVLLLKKGTKGENRFGPEPKPET